VGVVDVVELELLMVEELEEDVDVEVEVEVDEVGLDVVMGVVLGGGGGGGGGGFCCVMTRHRNNINIGVPKQQHVRRIGGLQGPQHVNQMREKSNRSTT